VSLNGKLHLPFRHNDGCLIKKGRALTSTRFACDSRAKPSPEGKSVLVRRDDAQDAVGDAVASLWIRWSTLSQEKRNDACITASSAIASP
jgi:hypothetical protein